MGTLNLKILLAFLGGALLASVIVYMAIRPASHVHRAEAAAKPIYVTPATAAADQVAPEQVGPPIVTAVAAPQIRELPGDRLAARVGSPALGSPVNEKRSPYRVTRKAEIAQVLNQPPALSEIARPVSNDVPAAPPAVPAPPPESRPISEPSHPPLVELPAPPMRQPHTVTLTSGTLLAARIGETLTADKNQPGDRFLATLDQPVVVDGFIIAERGARLEGRIVEADRGGRVKGVSHLEVELVKLATADGQHVSIRTSPFAKQGQSSTGTDAAKVGIGAALGAAIGGIAGGGKGAGIGAGVGSAAGAGDVLLTHGKAATIPVETRVSFRIQEPVTITEHLR